MGLFDDITSRLTGKSSGGTNLDGLLHGVMGLISNPGSGGLDGLVERFKSKGLADIVSSWVGTGENKPISGEQIQHVLGNEQLQQIAEQSGTTKDAVSHSLASLLPEIIDKLTPGGSIPQGDMLAQGINALKEKFRKG
jgi:uncharacterized protein YidB (DUF937 family)